MRIPRAVVCLGLFVSTLVLTPKVTPQNTMAAVNMRQIIMCLQVGGMNWSRFYPDVFGVIRDQTNATGIYPGLRALGRVQNVTELGEWRLPRGYYYYFRSFFESGVAVDWQVASDMQGNIASLSFYPATQDNIPTPIATPEGKKKPEKPAEIDEGGNEPASPKTKSEACDMFPGLC